MGDFSSRYAALTQRLVDSVLAAPAHTPRELRRAVLARAARLGGGRDWTAEPANGVPAPLAGYADTVALHAYRVTDGDVVALQRAGNSDDSLFEVTVCAAVGAALGRLERGLAALCGAKPD